MFNYKTKSHVFNYRLASLETLQQQTHNIDIVLEENKNRGFLHGDKFDKKKIQQYKRAVKSEFNLDVVDFNLDCYNWIIKHYDQIVHMDVVKRVTFQSLRKITSGIFHSDLEHFYSSVGSQYKDWCVIQALKNMDFNQIVSGEKSDENDAIKEDIKIAVRFFVQHKEIFKGIDLNSLTFPQLKQMVNSFKENNEEEYVGDEDFAPHAIKPVSVVNEDGHNYYLYHAYSKYALEYLGCGMRGDPSATKWCFRGYLYDRDEKELVRDETYLEEYHENGDIYVIYEEDQPYMAIDLLSDQCMDVNDNSINMEGFKKSFPDFFQIMRKSSIEKSQYVNVDMDIILKNDLFTEEMKENLLEHFLKNYNYVGIVRTKGANYIKLFPKEILTKEFFIDLTSKCQYYTFQNVFDYIPSEYFADRDFVKRIIEANPDVFRYLRQINPMLFDKELFIFGLQNEIKRNPKPHFEIPEHLKSEDLFWEIIKLYPDGIYLIPALYERPEMIEYVLTHYSIDPRYVLLNYSRYTNIFTKELALSSENALKYYFDSFPDSVQGDPEVIRKALEVKRTNIAYIPESAQTEEMWLEFISHYDHKNSIYWCFNVMPEKFKNNIEFLTKCFEIYPKFISCVDDTTRNNIIFLMGDKLFQGGSGEYHLRKENVI